MPSNTSALPQALSGAVPSVAVLGCGYWGKNLVRTFAGLNALGAICDASPALLEAQRHLFPAVPAVSDFGTILADKKVQGVVIATPAVSHFEHARQALEAGKDVFVEKPLSLSLSQARQLVDLAHSRGAVLMVGHLIEYHPAFLELRNRCNLGELGTLRYLSSHRLNLGKVRMEENVWWSLAPHDLSLVCALAGGAPETITVHASNWIQPGLSDAAIAYLNWAHGITAQVSVSWAHPFKEQKLVVVGDAAMAIFDDTLSTNKLTLVEARVMVEDGVPYAARKGETNPSYSPIEPLREECAHFLDCITTRQLPLTGGQSALRVVAALQAGQISIDRGGSRVELRELEGGVH